MSLDWFAGQRCALDEKSVNKLGYILLPFAGAPVPQLGVVYTVAGATPCPDCGVHITIKELGEGNWEYPAGWFRPIDPQEMKVLRGLLTPEGGMPAKPETVKEPERVE